MSLSWRKHGLRFWTPARLFLMWLRLWSQADKWITWADEVKVKPAIDPLFVCPSIQKKELRDRSSGKTRNFPVIETQSEAGIFLLWFESELKGWVALGSCFDHHCYKSGDTTTQILVTWVPVACNLDMHARHSVLNSTLTFFDKVSQKFSDGMKWQKN